jgi:hypothetical protein
MRTVALALLVLAISVTPALAQNETPWAEKLFKEGITHDFGSIPRGTQLYRRFKMYNPYAVPLEIKLKRGCECLTVTASASVLNSKEEGYIDVIMDARSFAGLRSVPIYVTTGPQYVSTATLRVSANSRVDVVLNPGQVNFGVVPRGQPVKALTIDVEYAGKLDWRVSEIAKHSYPLDASFQELYRRPGQVGYQVKVTLKPDAPTGLLKYELLLKTNDPASPLVPILVEANVQASLTVAPNPVTMGSLKVGESVAKRVVVRASKDFRILSVDGAGDGVTTELPTSTARVQLLLIKFQPSKAGTVRRALQIKTDLDKEGQATVMVEGTAEP